jgi:hypothetical protein
VVVVAVGAPEEGTEPAATPGMEIFFPLRQVENRLTFLLIAFRQKVEK